MNDSLLSKTISFLRFPLIVGVVFIHSNILVVKIQGEMIRFDNWPFVTFIMNLFSTVFADVCVPLFFFISGFLFFYNSNFTKETYLVKLKKRIKTLLVPYLIWNFVGFVLLLIYVHPKVLRFFPLLNNYRVDIISFLSSFWVTNLPISMSGPANPINTPLWFIRDLMVLVVLSPIIWWLIKKTKVVFIIALGLIWFFTLGQYIGFPGLCHQSLFFFPLGAYFGINQINFVENIQKYSWLPLFYIVLAIIDALSDKDYYHIIHNSEILLGMAAAVYVSSYLLKKGKIAVNDFLISASFFVYALHNLFLGKMTKFVVMLTKPESPVFVLLIYFLMPAIAILICLGLYKAIKRYSPTLCTLLTGGR